MTFTAFGTKVNIPNCIVCGNWLGKHNCEDKDVINSEGAFIVKINCGHFFHGNCCRNKDGGFLSKCAICNEVFKETERINLHHSNWWTVDSFWANNFKIIN